MSLLEKLSDPEVWEAFYAYRTSLACPKADAEELRRFIDEKAWLPVTQTITENTVIKLLTWLLLRQYDSLFADGLYSFRPGRSAKDAVRKLTHTKGIGKAWAYKVDIHNYFNSVPVPRLIPLLQETLADDSKLYAF